MLKSKGTNFLSEINAFFKNNDASKAMNSMMDMISGLNMSERTLFDRSTRFNSKYSLLQNTDISHSVPLLHDSQSL